MRKGPGIIDRVKAAKSERDINQLLVESVSYGEISLQTSRRLHRVANRRKSQLMKIGADPATGEAAKK